LEDENAQPSFPDVKETDWFYADVGVAQKLSLIEGFADGTFRSNDSLPKDQMVAISMRSLAKEMNSYPLVKSDLDYVLSRYADWVNIPDWAKENAALAARCGLTFERSDLLFDPQGGITRSDAAVMLMRVFEKTW
ncbi:MAG: S-layer homology domain-containing protein, partial [Clostridiales bacterium]|nr:S-layer homology domain-containing protein [Clostridiales bacterium]